MNEEVFIALAEGYMKNYQMNCRIDAIAREYDSVFYNCSLLPLEMAVEVLFTSIHPNLLEALYQIEYFGEYRDHNIVMENYKDVYRWLVKPHYT